MPLSNDDRGWIMSGLSGVACIFGAAFICVDIIVRQFPGQRNFRIQDSDAFLSTSLSLSFGVMLFSALYNMLPSSKRSLQEGGFSPREAAWIMIACFIGGVAGIQVLSTVIHRYVPHEIVDCEHQHDDEEAPKEGGHDHEDEHDAHGGHSHDQADDHDNVHAKDRKANSRRRTALPGHVPMAPKPRKATSYFALPDQQEFAPTTESEELENEQPMSETVSGLTLRSRPSFYQRLTTGITNLATGKNERCEGPCYGFGDVCSPDCFKSINSRRAASINNVATETTPLLQQSIKEDQTHRPHTRAAAEGVADRGDAREGGEDFQRSEDSSATVEVDGQTQAQHDAEGGIHQNFDEHEHDESGSISGEPQANHHHHVPKNAFLSIGLQTSIAIALHKLPEGFITYATNHANPKLGVSVFLALFIHNITEGFALALPLYLALNNRMKAMAISFVLGGLSQPLGAGVAALWFHLAGNGGWAPNAAVYGGMFAVTAGILANVALQLFSESLDLTHSKALCMVGAFAGMSILGISGALTA